MAIKVTVKKVEGKNGFDFEKGIKFNVDIDGTLTFKKDSTIGGKKIPKDSVILSLNNKPISSKFGLATERNKLPITFGQRKITSCTLLASQVTFPCTR